MASKRFNGSSFNSKPFSRTTSEMKQREEHRYEMKPDHNRRNFANGTKIKSENFVVGPMRGGIRL